MLETALATGFQSGEAFARAFKLKFGCTPSAWRSTTLQRLKTQAAAIGQHPGGQESNPDQVFGNIRQEDKFAFSESDGSYRLTEEIAMNVRIVDLPKARVAYQRLIGPYGPAIGEFWRGTIAPWMHSNGFSDQPCYGIGYDDPSLTPANKCRYDACVEGSSKSSLLLEIKRRTQSLFKRNLSSWVAAHNALRHPLQLRQNPPACASGAPSVT